VIDEVAPTHSALTLVGMRKSYRTSTPRTALALLSVLSAAITMGAMVVVPAKFEFVETAQNGLAAARLTPIVSRETVQCLDELQADFHNRNLDRCALAMHAAVREPR
jgi:hypothetical protein